MQNTLSIRYAFWRMCLQDVLGYLEPSIVFKAKVARHVRITHLYMLYLFQGTEMCVFIVYMSSSDTQRVAKCCLHEKKNRCSRKRGEGPVHKYLWLELQFGDNLSSTRYISKILLKVMLSTITSNPVYIIILIAFIWNEVPTMVEIAIF